MAPRDLLVTAVDAYLGVVEHDPQLYRFLAHRVLTEHPGAHAVLAHVMQEIGRRVAVVIGEQLRGRGLDSGAAEPWAFELVGLVHAGGDWWLEQRTMPRRRLVEYLAALAWDGMGSLVEQQGAL